MNLQPDLFTELPSEEDLVEAIAQQRLVLDKLNGQLKEVRSRTEITCASCREPFQIKDAVFVQPHFYVPPRGCTEGDYWMASGNCRVICPKCECSLSFATPDTGKRFNNMRDLFKEIKREYER